MHVEAGLRTGGSNLTPFPEELNRQVISTIAAMHFAPTSENLGNLVRENIPVEQVFVTGNTGIDALQWASDDGRPVRQPGAAGALRLRPPDRRHHRPPAGELGRRAARDRRGGRAGSPTAIPRSASSCRSTRTRASREVLTERLQRPRQRAAHRAARLRDLRPAARPRPHRDHRLRRRPGRGAVAGQAGAGHPRDDRADRGASRPGRCAWSAPTPDRIFREGNRLLDDPQAYARWPSAENPYGDGQRRRADRRRASSTCCRGRPADPVRHRLQPRAAIAGRGRLRSVAPGELDAALARAPSPATNWRARAGGLPAPLDRE